MIDLNKKDDYIPQLRDYIGLKKHYSLHKSTISKLLMTGDFTNVVKVGNKNYFRKTDVEAWIASRTVDKKDMIT